MVDVTCYTMVGDNVEILDWCTRNASDRAGAEHSWIVVNWKRSETVESYCAKHGHELVRLPEFVPLPAGAHPEQKTAAFIRSLYAGFNAGYEHATTKWVARMGSDQFFSQGWLKALLACAERHGERAVYHCTTVESPVAKRSRHEIRDWGTTPQEFDAEGRQRFDSWANDLAHRFVNNPTVRGDLCDLWYNHPTRGRQRRPDGVTWLQTKALWNEFGPMNDRVVDGVAPDVAYMDRIYDAGVPGYLCLTASSYHVVRGESREVQQ